MRENELLAYVERAIEGDKEAFEQICKSKAKDVLYICTHLMGNPHDGEDAAQEVFVQMQKSISTLQHPETFPAWSNRVITFTCARMRRSKGVRSTLPLLDYADSLEEIHFEFLPEEFAEQAEKRQLVLQAMAKLPAKYRQALLLYYYEDLSLSEMCIALDKNKKAVENLLYRARQGLKKRIERSLGRQLGNMYSVAPGGLVVLTRILRSDVQQAVQEESVKRLVLLAGTAGTTASAAAATGMFAAGGGAVAGWVLTGTAALATAGAILVGSSSVSSAPTAHPQNAVPQQQMVEPGAQEAEDTDGPFINEQPPPLAPTAPSGQQSTGGGIPANSSSQTPPSGGITTQPQAAPSEGDEPGVENPGEPPPENSPMPDGPASDTPGTAPDASSAPSSTPEVPKDGYTITGTVVLVDATGAEKQPVLWAPGGVELLAEGPNGQSATATLGANGSYTLTLPTEGAYTITAKLTTGTFSHKGGGAVQAQTGAAAPTLYITKTTLPTGAVRLYGAAGEDLGGSGLNPATATLEVGDETRCTALWAITDENGQSLASGAGKTVPLTAFGAPGSLQRCTITFFITDAAGNTATAARDFVLFR